MSFRNIRVADDANTMYALTAVAVFLLQIKSLSALIHYTRTNTRINLQRGNQK